MNPRILSGATLSDNILLAIDTCGPAGSVALGRLTGASVEILGQIELEGRSYSSTLIVAVSELLAQAGTELRLLHAIVVVSGPGSFTGVRVGLAAVKGLAEPAQIPVVAVSRLEVLAAKAGIGSAALDAHRKELFLRLSLPGVAGMERLVGMDELASITPASEKIAVCDETAAALLATVWPAVQVTRVAAATAADALRLALPRLLAGDFANLERLDGHYLRRSDAEIFASPIA